jgi:hypothetical protein
MKTRRNGPSQSTAITIIVLTASCVAAMARVAMAQQAPTQQAQPRKPPAGTKSKIESFDQDPGWFGVNHRIAQMRDPKQIRQDFGFSPATHKAKGARPGEMGGFITAVGTAAFYGKPIEQVTLDQSLSASGKMNVGKGGTHLLLGFFNSKTMNEWRTPNTLAIRINGRGENFYGYVEYCTSKWRAGGDTTPFPSIIDPATGRLGLKGFPCDESLEWKLLYDPKGNEGKGVVTATIGKASAVCSLDETHKRDGAVFDHFGMMTVMKSFDSGSEIWFDDLRINDSRAESFDQDPKWNGRNNRQTSTSRLVRPWFDFGFSETQFAGGKRQGELGGQIFRGDCRYPERMACYGDRIGPLTLDKPLYAAGKVAMRRGVSDSTSLFGFYNSTDSMRSNPSQGNSIPESVVGVHIEGPSSEGFLFYPVIRVKEGPSAYGRFRECPAIQPDGASHDWRLEYNPAGAEGNGAITVTLDGKSHTLDLAAEFKSHPTTFDRFGIVTPWIDGNSQDVFWDDIEYTVGQE